MTFRHLRRDKADEGKTVEAQGMDGFLGILQSAVARNPDAELAGEGQDASAKAQEPRESTGNASQSFESMMEKKKRLKLEEKMATMDKYERRRFEMEQGLAAAPSRPRQRAEQAPAAKEREATDSLGEGGGENPPGGGAPKQSGPAGGAKRAAEDKIAAARERAKQRRMKQ